LLFWLVIVLAVILAALLIYLFAHSPAL